MIQQKQNWWDDDETVTPAKPAKTATPVKAPVKQAKNWWDDDDDAAPVTKPVAAAPAKSNGAGMGPVNPMVAEGRRAQEQYANQTNPIIAAQRASQTQAMGRFAAEKADEMARKERSLMNAASPIPFKDTGPGGQLELNQERPDLLAGRAAGAFVNSNIGVANLGGQLGLSAANAYGAAFDPAMQGALAGGEYGDITQRVADAAQQGGYVQNQQSISDIIPSLPIPAAATPGEMGADVTGNLAAVFTGWGAPLLKGGKALSESLATVPGLSRTLRGVGVETGENAALAYGLGAGAAPAGSDRNLAGAQSAADPLNYVSIEALRALGRAPGQIDKALRLPNTPTNAGGVGARAGVTPQANMLNPAARAAPQPAAPPQAATAPPVPPVPPTAPAATAAAPQPTPATVTPQPTAQALGPAERAVNAMPRKTREALWRALSNSGMNRQQAEAAIKSLNDLPEGQNSMFDFELVRRFGQQHPRLKTNLQAMGRDWAITIPKDPRKGSPNRVMDDNVSTQIKSEGEFIDRTARDVFGAPVTNTLEALEATRRTLSSQYNKLLDPKRMYGNVRQMRRENRPAHMERINKAVERLTGHLQRPEIMAEVPAWVRDRVMLDVAKDIRAQGGEFLQLLRRNDPQVAQLIDEGRPLRYTPELWTTLTNIYPTQVAHTLQSAYARAIREALSGPDVVARTAAEELIRLRGGSRVRVNAMDPDQRGFGLLHYLEEAVPGYRDTRKQYGDIMGAEEAAYLPESFFRIANNDVALDDWIKAKDELSPQQQAALKSGMTTQVQQALRKKRETLEPWELDQPDALSTPNLTTLSQQPVLNALEKAFGADGKKMADAIRAASTRTDRVRSIHPNYGPRTAPNQEATKNASNLYGDPWGSEQNVIDNVSGSLAAAGGLSALNPATAAAAPLLLTGAAAKGLWNQWKRNKQLTGEEAEALADFFFRSRRPDLAEQVRGSRGPSAGDYAGAALRDASIGTVAAAAADGDLMNNDPATLAAGAAGGAGVGLLRARGRNAASLIKPPSAPTNALRTGRNPAPAGPASPPAGAAPIPGQQSNASPAVTGALVGGATGYALAPEDQKGLGLVAGAIGGGVAGNRLARGPARQAPKPPVAPKAAAGAPKPAQTAALAKLDLSPSSSSKSAAIGDARVKYFVENGVLTLQEINVPSFQSGKGQGSRAIDAIIAQADAEKLPIRLIPHAYGHRRLSDGDLKNLYLSRGFKEQTGDWMRREPGASPASAPKPPPVKSGFGGGKQSLPMDEASRMGRAREQGFDVDTPLFHGTVSGGFDEFGGPMFLTKSPGEAAMYSNDNSQYIHRWEGKRTSEKFGDPSKVEDGISFADRDWWEPNKWYIVGDGVFRKLPDGKIEMSTQSPVTYDYTVGNFVLDDIKPPQNPATYKVYVRGNLKRVSSRELSDLAKDRGGNVGLGNMDEAAIKKLQDEGYDGVVGDSDWGSADNYVIFDPKNVRSSTATFDPSETQSSKLLAGVRGNPEAIGAGLGTVFAPDANGDGEVSLGERAGAAITGGVMGRGARALGNRLGGASGGKAPPGPRAQGFGGGGQGGGAPKGQPRSSGIGRTVAGGVIGGAAGGLAGEANPQTPETAQKIADNKALLDALLSDISTLEADKAFFRDAETTEIQKRLKNEGVDLGTTGPNRDGIDGNNGGRTGDGIRFYKSKIDADLDKAYARRKELEGRAEKLKQDAAFERTRPTDEQQSFRDFAPLLGGALGALLGKGARLGGSAYSKVAAKSAIKELDTLLNSAPIPKPKTMAQREAVKSEIDRRASNLNEFWRKGGADKPRNLKERVGMAQPKGVPFASKTDGEWTARAGRNVMSPSGLFPDRFIGRNVGPMDALIGGAGATEAYLANQNAERVKEDLKTAYQTAKDDPSEKNLARVQELEDQYALSKGWAMLGAGLAVGTGIGVFTSKYASKRGNVQMAEQELAILRRAIADLKRQPANALKTPKPPPAPSGPTIPPLPPARPRGTRKPPTP